LKRHKHLWEQLCSFENLAAAAREALLGKRGKPAGTRFFAVWEREVVRLERELREGSYRPGAYFYFTITDPKERVVAAAPFRDRVVHHALVRVIEPFFEPRFGSRTRRTRRAGACAARCSRGNTARGCPGAKNVRESRDPRWQLEQHREQSALLDPQQQHADELEQQCGFPCCEARERAARPVGRRTTAKAAGQNRGVPNRRGDAAAVPGSGTTGASRVSAEKRAAKETAPRRGE
jgi:hypothetical protein